jgi:hypothetical protein
VPYTSGLRTNSATAPILIQTNNGATSTSTWTFGADGTLTFPDTSVQSTAYLSGQLTLTLDGNNTTIDLSSSGTNFSVLVTLPAIGYEGSDTHTIVLGTAVFGQRLAVVNLSTLCPLTIGANTVPVSGKAEFIYINADGTPGWVPLYGTV